MRNRERLLFSSVICFLVGCVAWFLIREDVARTDTDAIGRIQPKPIPKEFVDPVIASPSLTPEDVIRKQVSSLRNARKNPDSLRICFALASPSNRELTGPFERFAAMVTSSPYNNLGAAESWQVGEVTMEGDFATALVTTIASDGVPNAFRFSLQKQTEQPFTDCWMTVAVEYVQVLPGLELSRR